MPAFGRDARRFQAGRARSDHHDTARLGSAGNDVRHRFLAARGRVVQAQCLAPHVDAIEAVRGADARPNLGFATLFDLAHEVRVGDVGSGHANQVDLAFGDGIASRRNVVDLRGVQHG
jgi:hypothetical protein